jgi:hypothetical protein
MTGSATPNAHASVRPNIFRGSRPVHHCRGFEAAIISDYKAETAVERELVCV